MMQKQTPVFIYSDRRLIRSMILVSSAGFALAVLTNVFAIPGSILLDCFFATCALLCFVFLLESPEYRFYFERVRVKERPFSGSLDLPYDRIQYCRAIYPESFFLSSIIEGGSQEPGSLDHINILEIKPLSMKRRFVIRANPVLSSLNTDLLHFVNERQREMKKIEKTVTA